MSDSITRAIRLRRLRVFVPSLMGWAALPASRKIAFYTSPVDSASPDEHEVSRTLPEGMELSRLVELMGFYVDRFILLGSGGNAFGGRMLDMELLETHAKTLLLTHPGMVIKDGGPDSCGKLETRDGKKIEP